MPPGWSVVYLLPYPQAAQLVVNNVDRYNAHMSSLRGYLEEQLLAHFRDKIHFNGRVEGSPRIPNTCNVSLLGAELQGTVILKGCSFELYINVRVIESSKSFVHA